MAIDPVCGMEVDPDEEASAVYRGETYYFCAEGCKEKFVSEPGKYVSTKEDHFFKRITRPR